jgi:hypothetical protein
MMFIHKSFENRNDIVGLFVEDTKKISATFYSSEKLLINENKKCMKQPIIADIFD